ncbi:hypothetical protein [Vulcanisaeta distributa]|uniref:hypothetical protein n=1 Tax=Vulcanisaeta distributa TaxID=164451 RepID=UPI0006D27E73|nr:hypothetical protein [Vulcanisaeta distributa]
MVSPSTESINEAFTGLLVLPNNTSYVITGFLGSSSIYIISIERMPNQSVINTQYGQYYNTVENRVIRESSGNAGNSAAHSLAGNLSGTGGTREIGRREITWSINYLFPLIIIVVMLVIIHRH